MALEHLSYTVHSGSIMYIAAALNVALAFMHVYAFFLTVRRYERTTCACKGTWLLLVV